MKHRYELRRWNDNNSITTVLKINDEPKNAKKKAKEYRDWETDRKSTRLNSSHITRSRMPSSA